MELYSAEAEIKDHLGLFFDSLKVGDIVLLHADLGMGKTTLVRNFIEDRFVKSQSQYLSQSQSSSQSSPSSQSQSQSQSQSSSQSQSKMKDLKSHIKSTDSELNLRALQFSSPSYNLVQEYKINGYTVYHIDLYRLDEEDQIASVGLWDILADPNSIIFMEWAEKLNPEDIPKRTTYEIKITDPNDLVDAQDSSSRDLVIESEPKQAKVQTEIQVEEQTRQYTVIKIFSVNKN